jgi:hypothetical protein
VLEVISVLLLFLGIFGYLGARLVPPGISTLSGQKSISLPRVGIAFDGDLPLTKPLHRLVAPLRLEHMDGTLKISDLGDYMELRQNFFPMLAVGLSGIGAIALSLFELCRRLFRNVDRGDVFVSANVAYMRGVGALVAAVGVFLAIAELVENAYALSFARSHFAIEGMTFVPARGGAWSLVGFFGLVGLAVFVLAEVFNRGVELKNENDLTI